VPELASRCAQKRSEISSAEAECRVLKAGPRGNETPGQTTPQALEAAIRAAELDAARAHVQTLQAELKFLQSQHEKQQVCSPVCGLVTTPHVKERIGQLLKEGDLICVIEEPADLELEIMIAEQDLQRVRTGQSVVIKPRALPHNTFQSKVDRIAPVATTGPAQSNVLVYCRLSGSELRPGMSGQARISCGAKPIARVVGNRLLRFLRTEFWW
jgi:multidrug resistance efflux pump